MMKFLFGSMVAVGGYVLLIPMVWLGTTDPLYLLLPALAGVVAGFLGGGLLNDFTCELWDAVDTLIARDGDGREAAIPLGDIERITYSFVLGNGKGNISRLATLVLKRDHGLGMQIRFLPKLDQRIDIDPYYSNAYIERLRHRVELAKRSGDKPKLGG